MSTIQLYEYLSVFFLFGLGMVQASGVCQGEFRRTESLYRCVSPTSLRPPLKYQVPLCIPIQVIGPGVQCSPRLKGLVTDYGEGGLLK